MSLFEVTLPKQVRYTQENDEPFPDGLLRRWQWLVQHFAQERFHLIKGGIFWLRSTPEALQGANAGFKPQLLTKREKHESAVRISGLAWGVCLGKVFQSQTQSPKG